MYIAINTTHCIRLVTMNILPTIWVHYPGDEDEDEDEQTEYADELEEQLEDQLEEQLEDELENQLEDQPFWTISQLENLVTIEYLYQEQQALHEALVKANQALYGANS